VTNAGSGNVTMINTADNSTSLMALDTLGNPFNSDASPYLADLTPDDRYLFVTDYAAGATNIYVFDLQMDPTKPLHVIPVGGRTVHVAVTPDGQAAFACDLETNSVHVIAIPAFTVQTIPNVGKQPHGVTFTPDGGRAYVTTENLLSPDPPHHPTTEGTGVSYVYIIDVASLTVLGSIEVSAWSQGIAFMP
jgi:DNA-binding beta-propeller fold protein YncE